MAAKKREQQVNSIILTAKYLTNKKLAGNGPSWFVVYFIRHVQPNDIHLLMLSFYLHQIVQSMYLRIRLT
jgi:hypothetical protein